MKPLSINEKAVIGKTFPAGFLLVGCLFANSVFANPVVSGNTISWPDDGWYQVQSTITYESLCEGGISCEVEPGQYIVINHSNGQRYENIVVAADVPEVPDVPDNDGQNDPGTNPVVSGNTISWPDDGWYQVQSATTYESLCEGGTSCEVEPGQYFVINHSNGQRYENIVVTADVPDVPDDDGQYDSGALADKYITLLGFTFDIYTGRRYARGILSLPDNYLQGFSTVYTDIPVAESVAERVTCSVSGDAIFTPVYTGERAIIAGWDYEFDACFDSITLSLDGQIERTQTEKHAMRASSTGLEIGQMRMRQSFSGLAELKYANDRSGDATRYWKMTDLSYAYSRNDSQWNLHGANTVFSHTAPYRSSMSGGFSVEEFYMTSGEITVQVIEELVFETSPDGPDWDRRDSWYFQKGKLSITDGTGDELMLDADNGDFDSVRIQITQNGNTESFTQPWSTWEGHLRLGDWVSVVNWLD